MNLAEGAPPFEPSLRSLALPALCFTVVRGFRFSPSMSLGTTEWLFYILGWALPLGLWWGLMRELAGGPCGHPSSRATC